jgi:hypothetical protein
MDIEWQKRKVKSQYYVHFRIINVTKEISPIHQFDCRYYI